MAEQRSVGRIRAILAVALLSVAGASPAPAASSISIDTLKDVTKTLSSDDFGGRAPGTPGEDKSIRLIADRFRKAGLRPGANGGWYQTVPMVEITPDPKMTLDFKGGRAPLTLDYKKDMAVYTHRVERKVTVSNSEVVFVGYGIDAPELGWNDYAGIDVRGKTVIILTNEPDYDSKTLDGPFGGRALTYYGRWPYKLEEAARQGAAAALVIHDMQRAAYGFNVVVSSNTGKQLILADPGKTVPEAAAIGWISENAASRIMAASGKDLALLEAAAKQKGFRAVPLGLTMSTEIDNTLRPVSTHNVVGVLPGKTRPDEYVLLTAHWDHLGHCEPVNGDDICNGAIDNATGVAGLIAVAEADGKAGPAGRSIVFMATTGEESWLSGSEYYARYPLYPLAQTVGGVNFDCLSVHGASRDLTIIGAGKSDLDEDIVRLASGQGQVVDPEAMPEKGMYYRADQYSLAKRGVPMAYFQNGFDLVDGGPTRGRALAEYYIAHHYHAPSDEYHADWDWAGAVQEVGLAYDLTRKLADSGEWPNWKPLSEFRAIRDKSRNGR